MRPWLFHIGDFGVPSYWALLMIGFMAAIYLCFREAKHDKLESKHLLDLNLLMLIVGVLGARLMHVLVEEDPLKPGSPILYHYLEHPQDIFKLWNGLAFYGGLILAIPVAIWFLRRRKIPVGQAADIYALCIPLGLFFGRLGCFLAGCCHGRPTSLPWGLAFSDPHSLARPLNVDLHPTQLYSAIFAICLLAVLWIFKRRYRRFAGQVFLSFAVLYPAGRFGIEFLRNDNRGMFFGLLSSSQLVSLVVMIVALILLIVMGKMTANNNNGA